MTTDDEAEAGDLAIAAGLSPRAAEECALVLASEGLTPSIRRVAGGLAITVPDAQAAAARAALADYRSENRPIRRTDPVPPEPHRPRDGLAAAAVSAALLAFFGVTGSRDPSVRWFAAGSADSARILGGELWRSVTALCLHADAAHVASNALFGGLFLTAVSASFGPGFGIALAILAGAAGNVANALFQGEGHVSVGASTAVFGAVGLLAGRAAAERLRRHGYVLALWVPIAAGLALIAMLGTGERTDIWAHLFGFAAGGFLGIPASLAWPKPPAVPAQCIALAAAAALLWLCWQRALA